MVKKEKKKKGHLNNRFLASLTVKIFCINCYSAIFSINFVQWRTLLLQRSGVCSKVLATIDYPRGLDI